MHFQGLNKRLLKPLLWTVLLLAPSWVLAVDTSTAYLTINNIQASIQRNSANDVVKRLATDFSYQDASKQSHSKTEYAQLLQKKISEINNYRFKILNSQRTIPQANGQYAMKFTLQENYSRSGASQQERHSQTWYFQELNGSILVTKIVLHD